MAKYSIVSTTCTIWMQTCRSCTLNCLALKCCVFTWEKLLSFGRISRVKICVEITKTVRYSLSALTWVAQWGLCHTLASFPGHVGGEKAAWYRRPVHVCPFPENLGIRVNDWGSWRSIWNTVWACFLSPWVSVWASQLHLHRSGSYVLANGCRFQQAQEVLAQTRRPIFPAILHMSLKRTVEHLGFTTEWQISWKALQPLWVCAHMRRLDLEYCPDMIHVYWQREPYNFTEIDREWLCMHKQLIPGHFLLSYAAWERGYVTYLLTCGDDMTSTSLMCKVNQTYKHTFLSSIFSSFGSCRQEKNHLLWSPGTWAGTLSQWYTLVTSLHVERIFQGRSKYFTVVLKN